MKQKQLAEGGEILLAAYEIIVSSISPLVESVLAEKYKDSPTHRFDTVNDFRQRKKPYPQAKLTRRSDRTIRWDLGNLCSTIEDFWPAFRDTFERNSPNAELTKAEFLRSMTVLEHSIPLLKDLRNRAAHFPASQFSELDRNRFLYLAEHFLRLAGLDEPANAVVKLILSAEQLASARHGAARAFAADQILSPNGLDSETKLIGDLSFQQIETFPQWAAHPKIVALPGYGLRKIVLSGLFSSSSEYFRFGFKLMTAGGPVFSPGSIQTDQKNVVIHIGKNIGSSKLFVTIYKMGMRLGLNKTIREYADNSDLPLELELGPDGTIRLKVADRSLDPLFFQIEEPTQLAMLAWGDENPFECKFRQAMIGRH